MKKYLLFILFLISMSLLYSADNGVPEKISVEKFFENYVVKIHESNKNLEIAQRENHFERIGTETVHGDVSGTLFYTVKIRGLKAFVTFRYTNFSVQEGWTFDGEMTVTSDPNQSGFYSGTITVMGDYPATVCYDNIKMVDGKPSSGEYYIVFNKKQEKIPYSNYLKICETYGIKD